MVNEYNMNRRQFLKAGATLPFALYSVRPLYAQEQQNISKRFMEKIGGFDASTMDNLFTFDEGDCQCYLITSKIGDRTVSAFLKTPEVEGTQAAIDINQPLYLIIGDTKQETVEVLQDNKLEGRVDKFYKTKLDEGEDMEYTQQKVYTEAYIEKGKGITVATLPKNYQETLNTRFSDGVSELMKELDKKIADYIGVPLQTQPEPQEAAPKELPTKSKDQKK